MAISTSYCDEFYLYICSTDLWHELIWEPVVRILSCYVLLYFHTVSAAERITVNQIQSSSQQSNAEQHDTHTEGDTPSDQPYQRLVCNSVQTRSAVLWILKNRGEEM